MAEFSSYSLVPFETEIDADIRVTEFDKSGRLEEIDG